MNKKLLVTLDEETSKVLEKKRNKSKFIREAIRYIQMEISTDTLEGMRKSYAVLTAKLHDIDSKLDYLTSMGTPTQIAPVKKFSETPGKLTKTSSSMAGTGESLVGAFGHDVGFGAEKNAPVAAPQGAYSGPRTKKHIYEDIVAVEQEAREKLEYCQDAEEEKRINKATEDELARLRAELELAG